MTSARLLIADDHELAREGLRALLDREPGLLVVAEASTGEEAVALAEEHKPDLALLDIRYGVGMDGLEAARRIAEVSPDPKKTYNTSAVIAPDGNRSAMARSITTRRPLWVQEVDFGDGTVGYATDGTPVDCVRFATLGLIEGAAESTAALLKLAEKTVYAMAAAGERMHLSSAWPISSTGWASASPSASATARPSIRCITLSPVR